MTTPDSSPRGSAAFVRAADVAWEEAGAGVRRQILGHGSDLMLVRVDFERGAVGALHHHPHRQATFVVAGRFEVTIGDARQELGAGDSFFVTAGVPHSVAALEAGTLLDAFTPRRDDFLAGR